MHIEVVAVPVFMVVSRRLRTDVELWRDLIEPLRTLLALALREPPRIGRLEVRTSLRDRGWTVLSSAFSVPESDSEPEYRDSLLTITDVRDQLGESLDGVAKLIGRHPPMFEMYSRGRENLWRDPSLSFVELMPAVEALHGVLARKPSRRRGPELKERLNDLLCLNAPVIDSPALHGTRQYAIRRLVQHRNFVAHGLERGPAERLSPEQVHWACELLSLLFELTVLRNVGFPAGLLGERLSDLVGSPGLVQGITGALAFRLESDPVLPDIALTAATVAKPRC